tara:strand:+ start:388 stop:768 length:381 start_codon:yes stop_codon:yes gene_type:complete
MPKVEVSFGEYFDKLSILEIKLSKITDGDKLLYIKEENNHLLSELGEYSYVLESDIYLKLNQLNSLIWDVEDAIREKEYNESFDEEFIDLARQVYKLNDERFNCKSGINNLVGSSYKEQKSHKTCY